MNIEDLNFLWEFNKPIYEGCEIECPECKEYSLHTDWIETEVGCEDCGSHSAIQCPKCDEPFDHCRYIIFNIK
jgi:uncharacterized protein (DUF983 family)